MAARELASDVFDVVAHPARLAQVGNDPGGEGVAPDIGEVLAEQVGRSRAVAETAVRTTSMWWRSQFICRRM